MSPILCINFIVVATLLRKNEIEPESFCHAHNFFALYIENNMLVPGLNEKYISMTNINQFQLKDLPVAMFKACAKELTSNYIDYASMQIVLNLTWF